MQNKINVAKNDEILGLVDKIQALEKLASIFWEVDLVTYF
jgi:hypothetical protein